MGGEVALFVFGLVVFFFVAVAVHILYDEARDDPAGRETWPEILRRIVNKVTGGGRSSRPDAPA